MPDKPQTLLLSATASLVFMASAWSSSAAVGDLSLSVPMLGSTVVMKTSSKFAGAVYSLVFRGRQFINSADHGRELQSDVFFGGYGICDNPTEAGSRADGNKNTTSSVLEWSRAEGNQLWTVTRMAFWLQPGQAAYPKGCGRTSLERAVNTTVTSRDTVKEHFTVGLPNFPNVIRDKVTFYISKRHKSAVFEALTGYVPKDFSRALYYHPKTKEAVSAGARQGEQKYPVILATPDNRYAIAVYSPELPQPAWPKAGYGRFSFKNVNKWNCVFRESDIQKKPYSFECFIVLGTLRQVEGTLSRLYAYNK
jgi:hypothetical protein